MILTKYPPRSFWKDHHWNEVAGTARDGIAESWLRWPIRAQHEWEWLMTAVTRVDHDHD